MASDDRILNFLQLSDALPTLKQGKERFVLTRGDVEVRFEAAADAPIPAFPAFRKYSPLTLAKDHMRFIAAMMETVPKTGWGALNPDMLGLVLDADGTMSTDNTSLAFSPKLVASPRLILPRPFCLALSHWCDILGMPTVTYTDKGVLAKWDEGARLYGSLPATAKQSINFEALKQELIDAEYVTRPKELDDIIDEAAIFSDDLILEETGDTLKLSTSGEISWNREIEWVSGKATEPFAVALKRFATAVKYATGVSIGDKRVYLRSEAADLYMVMSARVANA